MKGSEEDATETCLATSLCFFLEGTIEYGSQRDTFPLGKPPKMAAALDSEWG